MIVLAGGALFVSCIAAAIFLGSVELGVDLAESSLPMLLLTLVCFYGLVSRVQDSPWPGRLDLLHPRRLLALVFLLLYVMAPLVHLFTKDFVVPHPEPFERVLPTLTWWCLGGVALFFIGYGRRGSMEAEDLGRVGDYLETDVGRLRLASLLLIVAGSLSYLGYIQLLGGFQHVLTFEGSRTTMYVKGSGYLFYLLQLGLVGCVLHYAVQLYDPLGARWYHWIPSIVFVIALTVLMGRSRALIVLAVVGVVHHYVVRPLRARTLILVTVLITVYLVGVREYRATDRSQFWASSDHRAETLAVVSDNVMATMVLDLSRTDALLLLTEHVPRDGDFMMGRSLLSALGPVYARLGFGPAADISPAIYLHRLMHGPREMTWGFLVSLVGELYINFGWLGMLVGLLAFGRLLRAVQQRLLRTRSDPLLLCPWAFVLVYLIKLSMAMVGILWELWLDLLVLYVVMRWVRRGPAVRAVPPSAERRWLSSSRPVVLDGPGGWNG